MLRCLFVLDRLAPRAAYFSAIYLFGRELRRRLFIVYSDVYDVSHGQNFVSHNPQQEKAEDTQIYPGLVAHNRPSKTAEWLSQGSKPRWPRSNHTRFSNTGLGTSNYHGPFLFPGPEENCHYGRRNSRTWKIAHDICPGGLEGPEVLLFSGPRRS